MRIYIVIILYQIGMYYNIHRPTDGLRFNETKFVKTIYIRLLIIYFY